MEGETGVKNLRCHGDQNSERHLKINKIVKQQKCPLKTWKCKCL